MKELYDKLIEFIYSDKFQHMMFIYAGMLTLYLLTKILWLSIVIVSIIALAKEIRDRVVDKQIAVESLKDLFADLIGLLLGLIIIGLSSLK